MADNPATVTVPRELLREVLDDASRDNDSIEAEMSAYNHRGFELCEKQRARIAELRRLAGMEE